MVRPASPKTDNPISPTRFALALQELPLEALQAKAAEQLNSIAHLLDSNRQLLEFVSQGDQDCADAVEENKLVVARMRERVALVRAEVERRGGRWSFGEVEEEIERMEREGFGGGLDEKEEEVEAKTNADAMDHGPRNGVPGGSGRLTDEELRRRMEERLQSDSQDTEDGVHL